MDDIQDIQPGKLKRKARHAAMQSVVDLPAQPPCSGNLLGESLLGTAASADETKTASLSEADIKASFLPKPSGDDLRSASAKCTIGRDSAVLKPVDDASEKNVSPIVLLDAVMAEPAAENVSKVRVEKRASIVDPDSYVHPDPDAPMRLTRRKSVSPKNEEKTDAADRIEEIVLQSREINRKCIDTLAKLQDTNAQNERRYALYLTLGFILLVILTAVGAVIGVNLRSTAKNNELKFNREVYENAVKSHDILQREFDAEKAGSAAAFDVYQRIEQGLFEESVEKFTEVRNLLTHPAEIALLEQKIDDIRWKLAENAYHDGVMLFNASNYEQARDAFYKSLSHRENTAYTPRLSYYLAMSLFQLGDFEGARRYFAKINPADLSPEMDANTRFYRAASAEKLGDETEAYEQYDAFLKKYRYHRLADEAEKRRAKVDRGRK